MHNQRLKVSVKNTDNNNVSRTVTMLLSIAIQLRALENPLIPAKIYIMLHRLLLCYQNISIKF